MLILVDGQKAKTLNQLARELLTCQDRVREDNQVIADNKSAIKNLLLNEVNDLTETCQLQTNTMLFNMVYQHESVDIDKKKLQELYPEVYQACLTTKPATWKFNGVKKR